MKQKNILKLCVEVAVKNQVAWFWCAWSNYRFSTKLCLKVTKVVLMVLA